jgi:hypothetical protein
MARDPGALSDSGVETGRGLAPRRQQAFQSPLVGYAGVVQRGGEVVRHGTGEAFPVPSGSVLPEIALSYRELHHVVHV